MVQSYLLWLQDSDYSPQCDYCNHDLANEVCVRLVCYRKFNKQSQCLFGADSSYSLCLDVFHWVCLDKYARGLPSDTAPAGYTCRACNAGLFPPDNMAGPVADALKDKLRDVNWARAGLGLPLLEGASERRPEFSGGAKEPPVPTGPRLPPEGENDAAGAMHAIQVHAGGTRHGICRLFPYNNGVCFS